jgi:RNA polymerase sigma factor (sigma-70 family)
MELMFAGPPRDCANLINLPALAAGPTGLDSTDNHDDWHDAELRDAPEADAVEEVGQVGAARHRVEGQPLNDAALAVLIHRIGDRDPKALESLYDATSARVYGLVLRITQQRALAEEVVEDTFWQVWRQALRFDGERGKPMTWLLAMARSRAIDALRRDQRFVHDDLADESQLDQAATVAPPQDLLDAARGAGALHKALEQLDARARQLVSLAFFRGLTHEEIATQEQLPLGTVKSLIRRSLQQLRLSLQNALGGPP